MSILVTGGAGYVGSAIMEHLVEHGNKVVCIDNFSTGHKDAVCDGATLVEGSILDDELVNQVLRDHAVECVVHCAAHSIVPVSNKSPLEYFENNVVGAHVVLKAMIENRVRHFVLSSTAAVYGNPVEIPIPESHPIAPINAYGRSKRMIEDMLEWHARAYDFSYVSLRFFNAAGATEQYGEDHDPETHLISIVLDVANGQRAELDVFGGSYGTRDGSCVRDFIHVRDLATAHARAIEYLADGGESEVLNLGSGEGHTVLEVIAAARKVTDREIAHRVTDPREGDAPSLVSANERARAVLGWEPAFSDLETMVTDAWAWKSAHPDGYQR